MLDEQCNDRHIKCKFNWKRHWAMSRKVVDIRSHQSYTTRRNGTIDCLYLPIILICVLLVRIIASQSRCLVHVSTYWTNLNSRHSFINYMNTLAIKWTAVLGTGSYWILWQTEYITCKVYYAVFLWGGIKASRILWNILPWKEV